ncbi:MAG: toxic anion resistance protein [Chloroflexi bacterium]|nr:toxic anion resistance protein [Chloroflexota bacterium]
MSVDTRELVLEPPAGVQEVSPEQAATTIRLDGETERHIEAAVRSFVDSLSGLDAKSPEFERKVQSIRSMGNEEIRRSSEVSDRFLDRPTAELQKGPLSQSSQVSTALLSLRRQIEELEPSRNMQVRGRGLMGRLPFGQRTRDYFRKYQSSQSHIEAIIQGLYRGQDELMRDNAALEQEKVNLWAIKGRLEQYAYMAGKLDDAVSGKVTEITDADKARAMKEDVLFYVRQKRQDLLTQLAVNVQGYLALDLIRKNNLELIKGVERATTTTVAALRTAVIAALALGDQRLVLDQITALNTTTGNLIESTSVMLRQQTSEIQQQAASATVNVEQLQVAFNNVYATIDSIDQFKLAALDTMKKTIDTLSGQVAKAQVHLERARAAEAGQAQANSISELALPGVTSKGH